MGLSKEDVGGFKGSWTIATASSAPYYNCYARVTAINSTSITIDSANAIAGAYSKFEPKYEIVMHVSASRNVNGNYATKYLGKWIWATITAVSGDLLTLDKDVTNILPADEFSKYYVQAIGVAKTEQFGRLFESVQTISPPAYSTTTFCGGIIIFKETTRFHLENLNIDLTDKGIPIASKSLRPWLAQENEGKLDTDKYAGWENGVTTDRLMLNAGDGAAFIVAKNFEFGSATTRIGNLNSKGVLNCRGASDSANKPSGVTNVGGSTILLVSAYGRTIGNYGREKIFSKYRSTSSAEGQGLGRACFVSPASTGAIDDQGCVAVDALDVPGAIGANFNIKNFGNGELGNVTNPTVCVNSYARITDVSSDRKQLAYTKYSVMGLAKIQVGALVMVVATSTSSDPETFRQEHGKMTFAKILSVTSTKITIDTALPEFDATTTWQLITVPQFKNFTLSTDYDKTPYYRGRASDKDISGFGGICVIACSETCDLRGGKVNVKFRGRPSANEYYYNTGTPLVSATSELAGQVNYGEKVPNSNLTIRFPPGGGDGAVLILANKLIMDASTRIGHTGTGNKLGGTGIESSVEQAGGGFKAPDTSSGVKGGAGYNTGTGSYACSTDNRMGGNVLIIADTIQDFHLSALSTGGHGKLNNTRTAAVGGCGYGGGNVAGGGYHGGAAGAGCAGNAFIFCNNAVNQNTSGIVVDE